jgi:putative membrane protein
LFLAARPNRSARERRRGRNRGAAIPDEGVDSGARKLERSTERMQRSTVHMEGSADRRTQLAADRTVFAAERTYAAWVRTGLVALASGVGAKKLLSGIIPEWMIVATGSLLVLFSAFCFVAAVWRQLYPGPPPPDPDTRRIQPWLLVLLNGFLALVAIAVLVGIWFGSNVPE